MIELLRTVYDEGIRQWLIAWYAQFAQENELTALDKTIAKADFVFGKDTWRVT